MMTDANEMKDYHTLIQKCALSGSYIAGFLALLALLLLIV
jgi:hypothetical protein